MENLLRKSAPHSADRFYKKKKNVNKQAVRSEWNAIWLVEVGGGTIEDGWGGRQLDWSLPYVLLITNSH